jgi:hypothetical protein
VHRLRRLGAVPCTEQDELADLLIARALDLSGQVVMRAARHGRYANELIGLVLGMERLRRGLEVPEDGIGWYFLDDYASWFGLKEEQIADILAIAPGTETDGSVSCVWPSPRSSSWDRRMPASRPTSRRSSCTQPSIGLRARSTPHGLGSIAPCGCIASAI